MGSPTRNSRADCDLAMIGLVVVTHGHLADELVAAAEHVVGRQANVRAFCVGPNDDLETRRREISAGVEAVDEGDGVIIVTDMFGGTPANIAISLLKRDRVEVLAGVNLPMLITLTEQRQCAGLADVAEAGLAAGRRYITLASRLLHGDEPPAPSPGGPS